MQAPLHSFIQRHQKSHLISLFGYASRGIPGLEINGLGSSGKIIKEKILFLTRKNELPIPPRRYALTVEAEGVDHKMMKAKAHELDFPLLVLYWYLAGHIPLAKIDDCLTSGKMTVDGYVIQTQVPFGIKTKLQRKLNPTVVKSIKFISSNPHEDFWTIDSHQLLQHVPAMKFR